MILHRIPATALLLAATSIAAAQTAPPSGKDFDAALTAHGGRFKGVDEKRHITLALHGRLAEAVSELENTVPSAEKTPIDELILGDMLYALDPALAYPHHRRAYAAYPDQVEAMAPMSMHFQRLGELDSALAIYEKLAARGTITEVQYALMAQCYVHAGMYDKALDAWTRANAEEYRTAIDFAVESVYGKANPIVRHDSLIRQVQRGRADKVGDLLDLGVAWDADWWNVGPNNHALVVDLDEIAKTFGATASVTQETRLLLQALAAKEKGKDAVQKLLNTEHVILGDGRLPVTTAIAGHLMRLALELGLTTAGELDARFHPQLLARVNSPGGDRAALDLLISFAAGAGRNGELAELNRRGWRLYNDPAYAFALLSRRLWNNDGSLKPGDDTLAQAMRQFPHDSRFPGIAYKLALDAGTATSRDIARVIDAEYYGLLSDRDRTSAALDALYGNLGDAVARERGKEK